MEKKEKQILFWPIMPPASFSFYLFTIKYLRKCLLLQFSHLSLTPQTVSIWFLPYRFNKISLPNVFNESLITINNLRGSFFPLEKEMATHSSILAWRIPRTEEPGGLQSTGSQRVRQDWVTSLHFTFFLLAVFNSAYHALFIEMLSSLGL